MQHPPQAVLLLRDEAPYHLGGPHSRNITPQNWKEELEYICNSTDHGPMLEFIGTTQDFVKDIKAIKAWSASAREFQEAILDYCKRKEHLLKSVYKEWCPPHP